MSQQSDYTKEMLDRVEAERERQKEMGYTTEEEVANKGAYGMGQLGGAGAYYLLPRVQRDAISRVLSRSTIAPFVIWPWDDIYYKPDGTGTRLGRIRELEKGVALGLAEMERQYALARNEIKEVEPNGGENFAEWYTSFKQHILLEREMGYEVTTMEQLEEHLGPEDELQVRGNYEDRELPRQAYENCYYEQ